MSSRRFISISLVLLVSGCASSAPKPSDTAAKTEEPPSLASQKTGVIDSTQPTSQPTYSYMKSTGGDVVAKVNGSPILLGDMMGTLMDAYGLNVLLHKVQLELAKQDAQKKGITITLDDIKHERDDTLSHMFKEAQATDYDQLLEQFFQQQRISKQEFDIVIETNAYLRKIAYPAVQAKITDAMIDEYFRSQYGESVQVRHIQCSNMQEIAEAKRRLGAGEPFEKVAKELSRNPRTAGLGGELPRFSLATTGLPDSFKQAAFALKENEISEVVQSENAFHLIKLEKRFPPKAVKFDDVKASIRETLEDAGMQQAIKDLHIQLGQQALALMKIEDPTLKRQFNARLDQHKNEIKDRDEIRKELEKQRETQATQQTGPTSNPLTNVPPPTTIPATAPAQAVQPPATKPAQ